MCAGSQREAELTAPSCRSSAPLTQNTLFQRVLASPCVSWPAGCRSGLPPCAGGHPGALGSLQGANTPDRKAGPTGQCPRSLRTPGWTCDVAPELHPPPASGCRTFSWASQTRGSPLVTSILLHGRPTPLTAVGAPASHPEPSCLLWSEDAVTISGSCGPWGVPARGPVLWPRSCPVGTAPRRSKPALTWTKDADHLAQPPYDLLHLLQASHPGIRLPCRAGV